jgi:gamma-glutamyltranspeptidase/glutathione hydrolase
MGLIEALAHGRVHHQFLPDELRLEPYALEVPTLQALEAKGHHIQFKDALGGADAVMEDPVSGLRYGASDPRREGAAIGQD